MFLFNWFRSSKQSNFSKTDNLPLPIRKGQDTDTFIFHQEEYDELLRRLTNLEYLINSLPAFAIPQPPPPPPTPPTPPIMGMMNCNTSMKSSPCDKVTKMATRNTPMLQHDIPFQSELENKLKNLREKMGASHGFGNFALHNYDDFEKLEKSVLEQSIMHTTGAQITRSPEPVNIDADCELNNIANSGSISPLNITPQISPIHVSQTIFEPSPLQSLQPQCNMASCSI